MADVGAGGRRPEAANALRRELVRLRHETVDVSRSRARLLLAGDADRRAIERTLHDGLQQELVAIAVDLGRAVTLLEKDPIAARGLLKELTGNLRHAIDEAATLAQRIYPPLLLEVRGLPSALRSAAANSGVIVTIQVSADAGYAPDLIAAVYWCCVEALAAAPTGTHATIRVADAEGGLRFEIGVSAAYPDGALERLRDRVEALGGELILEDSKDGGSFVATTLPSATPRSLSAR